MFGLTIPMTILAVVLIAFIYTFIGVLTYRLLNKYSTTPFAGEVATLWPVALPGFFVSYLIESITGDDWEDNFGTFCAVLFWPAGLPIFLVAYAFIKITNAIINMFLKSTN